MLIKIKEILIKNCETLDDPMGSTGETNRNVPVVHPVLRLKLLFSDEELFDGRNNMLPAFLFEEWNVLFDNVIGFVAFKFLVDKITN